MRQQFRWRLNSPVAPRPTMHGILGTDDRQSPRWIVEVHRAGFISVAQPLRQSHKAPGLYLFDATTCYLFRNFGALCDEIWTYFHTDVPCLLRSVAIRAEHVALLTGSGFTEPLTDRWCRPVFELPDAIRQPGESLDRIAAAWCSAVHNAFGTKAPPELLEMGTR
jgi:hypothetical protein